MTSRRPSDAFLLRKFTVDTTAKDIAYTLNVSLATAYRWAQRIEMLHACGPNIPPQYPPGRRRTFSAEQYRTLRITVLNLSRALAERWYTQRQGMKGRPKTAQPMVTIGQVRGIVAGLGVTCHDSTIRRFLAANGILTAGQKKFQRRRRSVLRT